MIYQHFLDPGELGKWFKLEVSLGSNRRLINEDKVRLLNFLKTFTDLELEELFQATSYKISSNVTELPIDKTIVRMLLLKKFIDDNKPSIIGEFLDTGILGRELEKYIFMKLIKQIVTSNNLPEDIYAYCVFRRRGSPTTWLKINNDLTVDQLKLKIDNKIKPLCNRLTYRLHGRRKLRMCQLAKDFIIYLIEKPIGVEVVKTENNNQEAQKVSYSLLIVDIEKMKIGYISGSKREVFIVQNYIKEVLFPNQIFTPRNDIQSDAKDLFKKILLIGIENTVLEVTGVTIKDSNLPKNPLFKLESKDNTSISEAILQVETVWRNLDVSNVKSVNYLIAGQQIELYSYGDEWKRRCLNVTSIGKSVTVEDRFLAELKRILSSEIKESRFVTENLGLDFIVNKLVKDKIISIDPPIPEEVEKIIVDLVKIGLLKKPKKIAKRICEDFNCRTISWSDWVCPSCSRPMIVVGNSITTEVSEARLTLQLFEFLESIFPNYEVVRQTIQRKNYKKSVIRLVSKVRDVALYIVPIFNKRDLNFSESLAMEGYGLITICDPNMLSKKEVLEASGCGFVELSTIISELKKFSDGTQHGLKEIFMDLINSQETNMLSMIYEKLRVSEKALREKVDYDEDKFEIDLKNIIQSLVPNVVRLGTKFKGKSVPDGYCSFKYSGISHHNLFGWDAKYSYSNGYKLGNKDFIKQQNYIKWLCSNSEPKSLGKLRIYGFISNFNEIKGFSKVLSKLRRSLVKPRRCKIVLVHDELICSLASWMLTNWKKVIDNGPAVSQSFFAWLTSPSRRTKDRWVLCTNDDWDELKAVLDVL